MTDEDLKETKKRKEMREKINFIYVKSCLIVDV